MEEWEKSVLSQPGAVERVRLIEDELRLAAGLTALRERAGLTQRELAQRVGVSQPRIAAIERSRNVTLDLIEKYLGGLGGRLEVSFIKGGRRTKLVGTSARTAKGVPERTRATKAQKTGSRVLAQKKATKSQPVKKVAPTKVQRQA